MAGNLSVRAIFGVKGNVANNVLVTEESTIVYPAGNYLVKYNLTSRVQECFSVSEPGVGEGIAALALSVNRRFIAVAEAAANEQDGYIISIFNSKTLSKRRSLVTGSEFGKLLLSTTSSSGGGGSSSSSSVARPTLRSLGFSGDDTHLVFVAGRSAVGVINIDKGKVVAAIDASLHPGTGITSSSASSSSSGSSSVRVLGASFSPVHLHKLCVWGVNCMSYYAIEEDKEATKAAAKSAKEAAESGGSASSSSSSSSSSSVAFTSVLTHIPSSPAFLDWCQQMFEEVTANSSSNSGSSTLRSPFGEGNDGEGMNSNSNDSSSSSSDAHPPASPVSVKGIMMMKQTSFRSPGGGSIAGGPNSNPGAAGQQQQPPSPGSNPTAADGLVFTSQVWLQEKDYNIVSTSVPGGLLLLFQRETYMGVLPSSSTSLSDGRSIDVMVPTIKGFLTAGEAGCIRIFESTQHHASSSDGSSSDGGGNGRTSSRRSGNFSSHDDKQQQHQQQQQQGPYICTRTLQASVNGLEAEDRIRSMCMSPNGGFAIFSLAGTQLLSLDVANANVKDDTTAFTAVGPPSHAPSVGLSCAPGTSADMCTIVSMSSAVRKPIVATVGIDGSVRLWNYIDKCAEMVRYYPEGATCIGLHPSGLLAVVGFQDRLRLMTVTLDDMRELRQYPIKGCQEVKFSRGGQYFAAISGNVILVYSAYTGEYIQTLRGHNGKITSIAWAYNDATLLSVAGDGAVYEWDMKDGKRSRELMLKGARFSSVAPSKDGATLFAVGDGGLASADGTYNGSGFALRQIDMNAGAVVHEWLLKSGNASTIVLSNSNPRLLFTGSGGGVSSEDAANSTTNTTTTTASAVEASSSMGIIRSYAVPIPATATSTEFSGPAAPIARMALSNDDAYLFVAGTDGCVIVYDVRDAQGRIPISEAAVKMAWAEETLLTVTDLEERHTAVRELRDTVAELQSNAAYNLRMKDMSYEESMKKMAERASTEIEQLRQQAELLAEEKQDSERDFHEQLASSEGRHRTEMQKRENMYQTKIMDEVEKYQSLQAEVAQQSNAWLAKRSSALDKHAHAVAALTDAYERELAKVRDKREGLVKDVDGARVDWTEMKAQMENDLDDEAASTRKVYQDRLDAEREQALKFKGENGIMKKKFAALQRDIEENKESVVGALERQDGLRRVIEGLEREIAVLRSQIYDRDTTIGEKEKRIYELKKKNQELEKFKFVLDYKIKELKGQVEPREAEISALRTQIKEVDSELEAYHKTNSDLDTMIGTMSSSLKTLQAQATNMRADANKRTASIRDFSSDLFQTVQVSKTPQEYVNGIHTLYKVYVPNNLPAGAGDVSVIAESERQREHLQTMAEKLKSKAAEESSRNKVENARLVEENLALIGQIKSLRDANTSMKGQLKTFDVEKARAHHQATARTLAIQSAARTAAAGVGTSGVATTASSNMRGGTGDMGSSSLSSPSRQGGGRVSPVTAGGGAGNIPSGSLMSSPGGGGHQYHHLMDMSPIAGLGAFVVRPSSTIPPSPPKGLENSTNNNNSNSPGSRSGGRGSPTTSSSPTAAADVPQSVLTSAEVVAEGAETQEDAVVAATEEEITPPAEAEAEAVVQVQELVAETEEQTNATEEAADVVVAVGTEVTTTTEGEGQGETKEEEAKAE